MASKIVYLFQKYRSEISSVSNSLDPDQVQHFVVPILGPSNLLRLLAENR